MNYRTATSLQYPLRPGLFLSSALQGCCTEFLSVAEFIESTWYLYRVSIEI